MGNNCSCGSTDNKQLIALNKMGIYTPKQIEEAVTAQWNATVQGL